MKRVSAGFPIVVDVTERQILIVGGGKVALRKARSLLDAGAKRIHVVAPDILNEFPPLVQRTVARYDASFLSLAQLVFAATDDSAVNDSVVADCRERSILVNRADNDLNSVPGDFITPAVLRDGPLLVAVSTSGFPALATRVRDQLAGSIDPRWRPLAEAMQIIRPRLRQMPAVASEQRRQMFMDLASDPALAASTAGADALWQWLVSRWPMLQTQP